MTSLVVFTEEQKKRAKILLAAKVASMMGRKLEEGDWSEVYCKAKDIPDTGWSNLHIDVSHNGLGIEFKMLRIAQLRGKPIKSVCGTTLMHPAATRSIRVDDVNLDANEVMEDVLLQYSALIEERTRRVLEGSPNGSADMRLGWLLWEDELKEFLYFEEVMGKPDPTQFYAEWNETAARGARKSSKSLWIYEKSTDKKRYSVTTSAGIKIQPYFDVPAPSDPNLVFFRVQSERLDADTVILWVAAATAEQLKQRLGSIDKESVSNAVFEAAEKYHDDDTFTIDDLHSAVPIAISNDAFELLLNHWEAVSDDHRIQLLLKSLD
ncbi:hypothetical protein [Jannaschia aquimarina]|uniref:Uncharacterized protein n=1 Tax=Jannaschia aquimarina TaxID=935700 RepID=A0A0D1EHN2_9RHOB|nr:hypothetical protein [Jannaschia aquimarina]KIT16371.1 hypothetical protein jaqu_18550 [Jannaschia aquimarina]SNT05010.1 hypothetical protein SAMN05421775_10527 [Jannaschia aquimarina]